MDNQTRNAGNERGRAWSGGYRLYMLHKGPRHGGSAAERRCRCKNARSAVGKAVGRRQPLCRAYVAFQLPVTRQC